jgi:hypothetical protein
MKKKDDSKTHEEKSLPEKLYELYIRIKNEEDDPSPDETNPKSAIYSEHSAHIDSGGDIPGYWKGMRLGSFIYKKFSELEKKLKDDIQKGKNRKIKKCGSNIKVILNTVDCIKEGCEIREGGIVIPKMPRIVAVDNVWLHYQDSNGKECVLTLMQKLQWVYYGGSLLQIKRKTNTDELKTIEWEFHKGIKILLDKIDSIPEEYKPKVGNKSITMSYTALDME